MDYCNSVLARLPWSLVQQLQFVLNSVACLVCGLKRFDHIIPTLKALIDEFALASIPTAHYIQAVYDYV